MKLLVLSDLHLECNDFEVPPGLDFDVLVLAGDIVSPGHAAIDWIERSAAVRRAKAVLLVPGNHEYYDCEMAEELQRMRVMAQHCKTPRVQVLDGDECVLDGVRFVGCTLWTDFALRINSPQGAHCDPARGIAAARTGMVDYRAIEVQDAAAPAQAPMRRKLTPKDTPLHAPAGATMTALEDLDLGPRSGERPAGAARGRNHSACYHRPDLRGQ